MAYEITGFEPVDFLMLNYTEEQIGKAARPMLERELFHRCIDPALTDEEIGARACDAIATHYRWAFPTLIANLPPLPEPEKDDQHGCCLGNLREFAVAYFDANVDKWNKEDTDKLLTDYFAKAERGSVEYCALQYYLGGRIDPRGGGNSEQGPKQ